MTAIHIATVESYVSRYVKRCAQCKQVRGNSQFNGKPGYRSNICRFCSAVDTQRGRHLRAQVRGLAALRIREDRLEKQLAALRATIREAEAVLLAQDQGSLFTK